MQDLVRLSPPVASIGTKGITGQVIALTIPFGSLITDIQGSDFKEMGYLPAGRSHLDRKSSTHFPYEKTFGGVPVGQPLVYIDSRGRVGIAVNQGDFSKSTA